MALKVKRFFWDVLLGRLVPLALFALAAVATALSADDAQAFMSRSVPDALHFAHELGSFFFFTLLTFTYVTRLPRRSGRRGPRIVLVVVMVSLASAIAGIVVVPVAMTRVTADLVGAVLVVLGTGYSLVALLHLRRSFSVLPEARELVTTGPYALTRHPLYLGETVSMLGVIVPLVGASDLWVKALALAIVPFVVGQWVRMRWEEDVLTAEFPGYAEYAARVPRFVPFVTRTSSHAG